MASSSCGIEGNFAGSDPAILIAALRHCGYTGARRLGRDLEISANWPGFCGNTLILAENPIKSANRGQIYYSGFHSETDLRHASPHAAILDFRTRILQRKLKRKRAMNPEANTPTSPDAADRSPDAFTLHVSDAPAERNWLPIGIAALIVIAVTVAFLLPGKKSGVSPESAAPAPVNAVADAYAASLPLSGIAMSESANLAGGKQTFLDGQVTNRGTATVTAIAVQVLFRNYSREVAQNQTQPLQLIRMREPYIDVQPVSADPIKPGETRDFRLIFDSISPDWDGAYPEIRVLRVQTR